MFNPFFRPVLISTFLFATYTNSFAEQDFSAIDLKVTHVSGNVYMLEGVNGFAGGNIGVSIGEDGILLIDDQFAGMSDKIQKQLSRLNPGRLRYILNTHWHGDHTGGNIPLGKDATIIAHDNVRNRLMADQKNAFGESPAKPKAAWPVVTFDQSLTIYFNNETIKVMHFPHGHTDGDSVIYFAEANVVHMGDHFFRDLFPFVDLNTGGNVVSYTENVGNILATLTDDVKIIPGHGPLSAKGDLIKYHQMLEDSLAFMRQQIQAGKSLEQIQQQGLPESFMPWSTGFIDGKTWLSFLYQSLAAKDTL